jgi:endoglucanase
MFRTVSIIKATLILLLSMSSFSFGQTKITNSKLSINDQGYYEIPGLNVMVFDDFYPEGHQGGITIIQFGTRVAANGDVRLDPTPGQWSPVPKIGKKNTEREKGIITVNLGYPDSSRDRKGNNPIVYPDLIFNYTIKTEAIGNSIKVIVDLEKPLPDEWADKVGFNLELFPGLYFGEHYLMDSKSGIFPRQANGPMKIDENGNFQITPIAVGKELIISPHNEEKEIRFTSYKNDIQLIDGRGLYNNGWFILRSTIKKGTDKNAVEWIIAPKINTDWRYRPVIQISQIGYHPKQTKFAVIELDKLEEKFDQLKLIKIDGDSESIIKSDNHPNLWGKFLRYKYLRFDFSDVSEEGLYKIKYGKIESNEFEIKNNIYSRNVWQPTLEYFLPVQMCHMKVIDRYKTWHGLCHLDDALMAPINHNHFDGYFQHESTLTKFEPGEHIPGLNIGGWHDAGDYDLRVESQAGTIYRLTQAYEFFKNDYDETTIDQKTRVVQLHKPDGKPDILQQVVHGILSIVNSYESMGRLYRGIICPTLEQYVLLGDGSTMTDNLIYKEGENDPVLNKPLPKDDRWVFTENNPRRELGVATVLAAAYRVLKEHYPALAEKCLSTSKELYEKNSSAEIKYKINPAAELYLSTSENAYEKIITENADIICNNILEYSEVIGRITRIINNKTFTDKIEKAVSETFRQISEQQKENPYGVPYRPYIWGAGWGIQSLGVKQLFLHLGFPKIFQPEYTFNALNFVLGCHPGENNASFVSGVGVNSLTVAYGVNRDDWSYIPGGAASGTALIRPDLPELKVWPYFWQQTEYVIGGGATNFMLLAMAADYLFNK